MIYIVVHYVQYKLCDMRDSDDTRVFGDSELKFMIDMLCTK